MKERYKLGYMIRLYRARDYFLGWDFITALFFVIAFLLVAATLDDSALAELATDTFDNLVSLTGILLGILIGAMAIMVSFSSEDFIRFIKMPLEGEPPLYDKVIFHFVWPTVWLSSSILVSLFGRMLMFSESVSLQHAILPLAVVSVAFGIYGISNAVKAIFSVSYLAILRGHYIEKRGDDGPE